MLVWSGLLYHGLHHRLDRRVHAHTRGIDHNNTDDDGKSSDVRPAAAADGAAVADRIHYECSAAPAHPQPHAPPHAHELARARTSTNSQPCGADFVAAVPAAAAMTRPMAAATADAADVADATGAGTVATAVVVRGGGGD